MSNPWPEYLPNAFYYGSFVLRDGRQVPLASFHNSYSQKPPETALGNGVAGAQIEAVMQAVAAFLGLEYALTGGAGQPPPAIRETPLKSPEVTAAPVLVPPAPGQAGEEARQEQARYEKADAYKIRES